MTTLTLPEGARWAGDNHKACEYPHLMRWPWWRLYGQTTIYTGKCFTPVVYCDSTDAADKVLALRNSGRAGMSHD